MPIIIENDNTVRTIRKLISCDGPPYPNSFEFAGRTWHGIKGIKWLDFPEPDQDDGGFAIVEYHDKSQVICHWQMKELFIHYFTTNRRDISIEM